MNPDLDPDNLGGDTVEVVDEEAPYAKLPEWIMLADIPVQAKTIYSALRSHQNRKRGDTDVWPAKDTIAIALGWSRGDKIEPYIKNLESIGALTRKHFRANNGLRKRTLYSLRHNPPPSYDGLRTWKEFYDLKQRVEDDQPEKPQVSPEHPHRGVPEHPHRGVPEDPHRGVPEHPHRGVEPEVLEPEGFEPEGNAPEPARDVPPPPPVDPSEEPACLPDEQAQEQEEHTDDADARRCLDYVNRWLVNHKHEAIGSKVLAELTPIVAELIARATDKNAPYYEITGLVKNKTHLKNPAAVIVKHLREVRDKPAPATAPEQRRSHQRIPISQNSYNETPDEKMIRQYLAGEVKQSVMPRRLLNQLADSK